MSAKPYNIML